VVLDEAVVRTTSIRQGAQGVFEPPLPPATPLTSVIIPGLSMTISIPEDYGRL
jgi:hypothetical protein